MKNGILNAGLICIFLLLLSTLLYAKYGDYTFEDTIELSNIEILKMKIRFPAGELYMDGHSKSTIKANCSFSEKVWRPEVFYERKNEEGRLLIEMPEFDFPLDLDEDNRNTWNLSVTDQLPVDLRINMGGGVGEFDFESLKIRRFLFSMTGGEIKLNLNNNPLERLDFKALAGEAEVDLSGDWQNDLDAKFTCGFGELTLRLPEDTPVRVDIDGVLGEINAPEFDRDGEYFVNQAEDGKHLLDIRVKGGIGQVNLILTGD